MLSAPDNSQVQDIIKIDTEQKLDISQISYSDIDLSGDEHGSILRVAISAILSPARTLESYQDLLNYLGDNLDRHVELILRPTYSEINDLIEEQRIDVAFICSLAYVDGVEKSIMDLMVVPQMYGKSIYYSYLIVPESSSAVTLDDLRGMDFAFTDPLSNTGYVVPSYQLSLVNETAGSFFGSHIFSYSHDNSVMAVADNILDGAAVDSLVYDQLILEDPDLATNTKIIARWGPFGIPPVVVRKGIDPQLRNEITNLLLEMSNNDEGQSILSELSIDRFIIASDAIYDSIRAMREEFG
jgi:phosphonate transport system substrate-binding protein